MRLFRKEEIDSTRNEFREKGYEEVSSDLEKRDFTYFILPRFLSNDLPDFVLRMTGEPEDGYVFGISESVDPFWRVYPVAHEFIECIEIGINTPNGCVKALEEELLLVPAEMKKDYISMRRQYFRNLASYAQDRSDEYTKFDVVQFQKNAEKLEGMMKESNYTIT